MGTDFCVCCKFLMMRMASFLLLSWAVLLFASLCHRPVFAFSLSEARS